MDTKPLKPLVATYSPKQAAALLGFQKSTILAAIDKGELPAIRANARVIRITATDAAAWYAVKGGKLKATPATSTTPASSATE